VSHLFKGLADVSIILEPKEFLGDIIDIIDFMVELGQDEVHLRHEEASEFQRAVSYLRVFDDITVLGELFHQNGCNVLPPE